MSKSTPVREPVVHQPGEGIWLWWLGFKLRYLATADETDSQYCLSVSVGRQGGKAPPHRHDFEEGFYLVSGEVEFTAGNQSVVLQASDFINIAGGVAHYPTILSETAEILTFAAPTGFDQFQLRSGQRLECESSTPTKSVLDIRRAIEQFAPQYNIEINPPAHAFSLDPDVHISRKSEGVIVDAVGDRYRFLAESEHTNGNYALWHATISPGGGPPLHTHSLEDEAFYILSGEVQFFSGDDSFTGHPGTFVNLPSGTKHRFSNQSDTPAEVLILVAPAGLEKMFRRTGVEISDATQAISEPTLEEKERLLKIAAEYGIQLHL